MAQEKPSLQSIYKKLCDVEKRLDKLWLKHYALELKVVGVAASVATAIAFLFK